MRFIRWCPVVFVAAMAVSAQERQGAGEIVIENGVTRLTLVKVGQSYRESFYAKSSDGWRLVLQNGSSIRPDPALKATNAGTPEASIDAIEKYETGTSVTLRMVSGSHISTKVISMKNGDPFVHITLRDSIRGNSRIEYFLSTYSFLPDGKKYAEYKPLDFVFTPQLRPESDEVIADHTFRSPALMMQKGNIFAALIPDIHTIDGRDRVLKSSADMQVETGDAPFISFGLMNWIRKKAHVYYAHADSLAVDVSDTSLSFSYYLYVSATAPERCGFQDVVKFEWDHYGHPNFSLPTGPQAQPFSSYIYKAW